jgi:ferric-dicitrate binding protein FerR (iron transport regulator)
MMFLDDLAAIVDGDEAVLARHLDHLAECDSCRDARHDAATTARSVGEAGADYEPPADLAARVLDAIEAETPAAITVAEVAPAPRSAPTPAPAPAPVSTTTVRAIGSRRRLWLVGAGVAALAAGTAWYVASRGTDAPAVATQTATDSTLSATIETINRAASDGLVGVEVRVGDEAWRPATPGVSLAAGTAIRTDERTRARVALSDGSSLVVNHATELTIDPTAARRIQLSRGEAVFDIEHLDQGPQFTVATASAFVDVLGTRFSVTADETYSSVRVSRGVVRVHGAAG